MTFVDVIGRRDVIFRRAIVNIRSSRPIIIIIIIINIIIVVIIIIIAYQFSRWPPSTILDSYFCMLLYSQRCFDGPKTLSKFDNDMLCSFCVFCQFGWKIPFEIFWDWVDHVEGAAGFHSNSEKVRYHTASHFKVIHILFPVLCVPSLY